MTSYQLDIGTCPKCGDKLLPTRKDDIPYLVCSGHSCGYEEEVQTVTEAENPPTQKVPIQARLPLQVPKSSHRRPGAWAGRIERQPTLVIWKHI